jgi:hypothetical protein
MIPVDTGITVADFRFIRDFTASAKSTQGPWSRKAWWRG